MNTFAIIAHRTQLVQVRGKSLTINYSLTLDSFKVVGSHFYFRVIAKLNRRRFQWFIWLEMVNTVHAMISYCKE